MECIMPDTRREPTSSLAARLFTLMLFLACLAPFVKCQQAGAGMRSDMVVSTQWLADHLSDPKLVIVDVGMGGMMSSFGKAHIPGAREMSDDQIESAPGAELLPDDQLKTNLEALGIGDQSRVVIYSSHWYPMAARLLFTLDYLGFKNAAMLDGGMETWISEKRPVTTDAPKITRGSLTIHPHPEIVARMADVQKFTAGADPQVVLLDARPMGRYKAGHLSGAVPFFWENNLVSKDHPVLKSADELRRMYAAAGVTPGKKIVSYCEVGQQASYAYFIARYLGYDAAMYDGSYSEWSAAKKPVVRGEKPR
jgi:thiosulfate/3-mercaptopyruvate sulfurtransferase